MVWCWWCCHPFDGPELHLPFKYDERRKQFRTFGSFCSWSCMKAYNVDTGKARYGEIQMFITLMRKHVYDQIIPCPIAPKRQCLDVFGGTMTIEEFRGCKDPPMVRFPNEIQTGCSFSGQDTKLAKFETDEQKLRVIQNASGQTESLKLRRTKPLKRSESALERSLGITRKTS